jgi:hypothetical protein
MDAFLNLSFEDAGSRGLVKPSSFEDMSRIDPVIRPSSHDTISMQLKLKHRNLFDSKKSKTRGRRKEADSERYKNNRLLTPLYVAEYIMPSFVPAMVPRLVPNQSILMILIKSSVSVKQSVFRVVLASCNQSIFYIRLRPR